MEMFPDKAMAEVAAGFEVLDRWFERETGLKLPDAAAALFVDRDDPEVLAFLAARDRIEALRAGGYLSRPDASTVPPTQKP